MNLARAGIVLTVISLLVVLALPGNASAKNKKKAKQGVVKVVTAAGSTEAPSSGIPVATATCPPGTLALGGGFDAAVPADGSLFKLLDSAKVGDTQWQVRAIA